VTPARRRLVALAAALAPRRALDLLARLGDGREEAGALAAQLAAAPRHARLAALAAALPRPPAGPEAGGHPLLARLAREAGRPTDLARPGIASAGAGQAGATTPDVARTAVRATDLRPGRRR